MHGIECPAIEELTSLVEEGSKSHSQKGMYFSRIEEKTMGNHVGAHSKNVWPCGCEREAGGKGGSWKVQKGRRKKDVRVSPSLRGK